MFAALAAYIRVNLAYAGTWGQTLALSALFALTAGGAMAAYAALEKPDGRTLALVGGVMALTMAARVSMLDYISSDYQSFLVLWLDAFRKGGFATLGENVGDYNLIYQYILLLISKAPLKDLYLIKLFSVIFDYALALSMARRGRPFRWRKGESADAAHRADPADGAPQRRVLGAVRRGVCVFHRHEPVRHEDA